MGVFLFLVFVGFCFVLFCLSLLNLGKVRVFVGCMGFVGSKLIAKYLKTREFGLKILLFYKTNKIRYVLNW